MIKKFLILVVICVIIFFVVDYRITTGETKNVTTKEFVIKGEEDEGGRDRLSDIGDNLVTAGIIDSKYVFYYYAWRNKLRGTMVAGTYTVTPHVPLSEMTFLFTQGKSKIEKKPEFAITFPEGLRIDELSAIVAEEGLSAEIFEDIAFDPRDDLRSAYSFLPAEGSLEGYLFPETYNFFIDATERDIIERMLQEFDARVTEEMRAELAKQDKSMHELVTLASIVEGEVHLASERPVVAGIFQNRLDIGMTLGSDETIDYIYKTPKVKHTLEDIAIDDPYNTYKFAGLPPGPVNNPSLDAIIAALYPDETEYLFFLNNATTGKTVFGKTLDEHVVNKRNNGL